VSSSFVQIGATRDGLDPYLDCARRRGMPAVLVETPAYLAWRRGLGRRDFDVEVAVSAPDDPVQVAGALGRSGLAKPPGLVLAGFERYVESAFALAARWAVPPFPGVGTGFVPVGKGSQRDALRRDRPRVRQPGYAHRTGAPEGDTGWIPDTVRYPQVVKPVDGGGGLGVFLVADADERARALAVIGELANYGGGAFAGVVVEAFVAGTEYSVQGLAYGGRARILAECEKLVTREPSDVPGLYGFRELGHICWPGASGSPGLGQLAQDCVDATGYREGPFHIDVVAGPDGPYFLEMGFRLSGGGLVGLVERATGLRWADLAFAAHLGEPLPEPAVATELVVGQVNVRDEADLAAAEELRSHGVRVDTVRFPPVPAGHDSDALASDRIRHTGFAGRVVVSGTDVDEVRAHLAGVSEVRSAVCVE
jgi:hypothetical protein